MSDQVFCYYCRRYHPAAEVKKVESKGGKRWRCLESLARQHGSVAERDAFGRAVSASNRAGKVWLGARPLPLPVLEVLSAGQPRYEGLA